MSIAKQWYEHTRNLSAFTVDDRFSKGNHPRKWANQYSTYYTFHDGSHFNVMKSKNSVSYSENNWCVAERILWRA